MRRLRYAEGSMELVEVQPRRPVLRWVVRLALIAIATFVAGFVANETLTYPGAHITPCRPGHWLWGFFHDGCAAIGTSESHPAKVASISGAAFTYAILVTAGLTGNPFSNLASHSRRRDVGTTMTLFGAAITGVAVIGFRPPIQSYGIAMTLLATTSVALGTALLINRRWSYLVAAFVASTVALLLGMMFMDIWWLED